MIKLTRSILILALVFSGAFVQLSLAIKFNNDPSSGPTDTRNPYSDNMLFTETDSVIDFTYNRD